MCSGAISSRDPILYWISTRNGSSSMAKIIFVLPSFNLSASSSSLNVDSGEKKKNSIILDLKYTIDVTRDVNIGFLRKPVILTIHGPLDKYFPGTSTERKNIPISVCSLVSKSHQKIPKFPTLVAAQQPPTADVWQCHLRADGLTPEISTEPSARSRVWENLYLF